MCWSIGVGAISALLVAGAAGIWAIRNWNVEVRYRLLSRPHLQVLWPHEAEERRRTAEALRQQEASDSTTAA